MTIFQYSLAFLCAYLLGSLNFGVMISKLVYKKDIRTFGSGNAGMTNMLRTFGKKAAAMTVTGDALKGTIAVLIARYISGYWVMFSTVEAVRASSAQEITLYIAVVGAVLGHMYPIYFKFKGGKGMAVVAGAMVAVTPITLLLALSVFLFIAFGIKIVSLASVVSSVSYIFITLVYFYFTKTFSIINLVVAVGLVSMIIYSHRANIKRLANGTEYRFGQKKNDEDKK